MHKSFTTSHNGRLGSRRCVDYLSVDDLHVDELSVDELSVDDISMLGVKNMYVRPKVWTLRICVGNASHQKKQNSRKPTNISDVASKSR